MGGDTPQPHVTVWTIGHSNHPLETFLGLLAEQRLEVLVDVRSSPYSGYASWFNREVIQRSLRAHAIEYLFLGDLLGGKAEGQQFYDEQGHVLYGRLAESAGFQQGIERLRKTMATRRVALLCGEEDPTACHRRLLIGRVLRQRGVEVRHIRGDGRVQSEQDVAAEEEFAKTKGQLSLFDMEEADEWKSTQSVLPRKAPANSSKRSGKSH